MKKKTKDNDPIENLCLAIDNETVELIDFDALKEALESHLLTIESGNKLADELSVLKEDYRMRILGMLKAITACREDNDATLWAIKLTDENSVPDAADLVALYGRTAVKFRECFPASFKYTGYSSAQKVDWFDHKI